ncbi:hypothetical protein SAMN05877753_102600 [Bacillus oleivorans]|uniref:Uncharacterized protein n=1 Tax=Bacillus oleivorans TaxID=1448271 RepID=A0A285CM00_9BACI|nr:hypothetical protein [Bacillus oleivorans]SNX68571.1 hypothetical protein SAMN05877753_102600 [Bacillus oleivorans]
MKAIVSVVVFVLIIILSTCGLETKTLEQFYEGNLNDVTQIRILDGNTGYSKTVTDQTVIANFLDKIKDIKFIPEENQEDRDGFNYAIALYENEKDTFSFSLTRFNGHYYHTEPEILPIVDHFYKNLNVKEE